MFNWKYIILTTFFAVSVIFAWSLYVGTQNELATTIESLRNTRDELSQTKNSLLALESSTTKALAKSQSNETTLKQALTALQNSQTAGEKSFVASVNKIAPSVVKIVCRIDNFGDLKQGSGILYKSSSAYFVQTNKHVVKAGDGGASACAIGIYPDYTKSLPYLVFQSSGFTEPVSGADVAFIFPKIINDAHAGNIADLEKYSQMASAVSFCSSQKVGDHLFVLGYPAIGGTSLTVTDGIVSGFESANGYQFIKTSAKIDQGNSGGIVIEDSGCVLGIPTFVEAGKAESIGRILDLGNIFKSLMPK